MAHVSHKEHEDDLATKNTKATKDAGGLRVLRVFYGLTVFVLLTGAAFAQDIPALTAPVNDFARVIDPAS